MSENKIKVTHKKLSFANKIAEEIGIAADLVVNIKCVQYDYFGSKYEEIYNNYAIELELNDGNWIYAFVGGRYRDEVTHGKLSSHPARQDINEPIDSLGFELTDNQPFNKEIDNNAAYISEVVDTYYSHFATAYSLVKDYDDITEDDVLELRVLADKLNKVIKDKTNV